MSAESVVLKAVPRICLAVSHERGEPITTFPIAVFRSENTSTGINHTPGPTLDINDPDGIGCVNSPWARDFSVEVDADGYAIHEEKFVRAEDREIRRKPEGRLQLTVLGEESAKPVSGAFIMSTAESDGRADLCERHCLLFSCSGDTESKDPAISWVIEIGQGEELCFGRMHAF